MKESYPVSLLDAGINGRAFMKLRSGQSLFDKLKEGTRMLIDELQKDLSQNQSSQDN